ncbi:MAG: methionyl-tRNA formyltransferase [Prevotella sp.]|nr:methionyl-tRNA formyltransferase [Prevotella sp.]MBQ6659082.1 methionyl-tRNA formyltransferase [Prevotella sp.]MBQ7717421.1 methionyl-tRNA formyltransferase [Prevotella sp.]MBQ9570979.1 methionyl-tRNA formyltransferase [Prevotella sp.]
MKKEDIRIIFMGTPEFAVETLKRLVENGYPVVAVVTQPDKPVGRHQDTLQPSAVKQYALSKGIPVLQPVKMKDPEFIEQLRSFHADLQVVVAFRMLPEVVWDMPRWGTFNVHAALLPQYRGAAPINWAVINGETETGVTTFFLDKDIDTGRIIKQKRFAITDEANVETVYDGLMYLGAEIVIETIDDLLAADGNIPTIAQEDMLLPEGTMLLPAPKIFRETCQVNWQQPAKKVYDFVRGLSPYPGAWTNLVSPDERKTVLKIFKTAKTDVKQLPEAVVGTLCTTGNRLFVKTEDSWLELLELQLSGKKRMLVRDFLNGIRDIEKYTVE